MKSTFFGLIIILFFSPFKDRENNEIVTVDSSLVQRDSTKIELPADSSVVDSSLFATELTREDSIRLREMKRFNPTLWDKINEENLCTGMKAPVQYRNGKIVRNN